MLRSTPIWAQEDCIPSSSVGKAQTASVIVRRAAEIRIIPTNPNPQETYQEYRQKLFARLRGASLGKWA